MSKDPFNNPFSKLTLKREDLPEGPSLEVSSPPDTVSSRAVLRLEKKGRGGKEVTVVDKLDLSVSDLESWLKSLKQAMGCGGMREGQALVLQGDQRERVEAWLRHRGVARISVG